VPEHASSDALLEEITEGRTDRVFDYLAAGHSATAADRNQVTLIQWCAYYGDVSAMRVLLANGASLEALGDNLDLNGACFHGHWRLVSFLIEHGADVNHPLPDTGETPLHAAVSQGDRIRYNLVLRVLFAHGANPNARTKPSIETGSFMRDCRTKAETPLHRAAAFGDEEAIQLMLDAGASLEAKDMNGDTPLSWASWYSRPIPILRKLLYGDFRINPNYGGGMQANLLGRPR
jgi:ankyrin repeat protein